MKVFDFTTGKKGKLIKDVGAWSGTGHSLLPNGRKIPPLNGYEFHWNFETRNWNGFMYTINSHLPEEFGVEAVCYCTCHNLTLDKWEWCFSATPAWLHSHGLVQSGEPCERILDRIPG